MDKLNFFTIPLGAVGGVIGWATGGFDMGLKLLLAAMVIDYASGLIASGYEGKTGKAKGLNSKVGFKGILKKIFILLMVTVSHLIDIALGSDGSMLRDAVIFFYFANEILSIVENAGRADVYVPEPLKQAVEVLKNKKK